MSFNFNFQPKNSNSSWSTTDNRNNGGFNPQSPNSSNNNTIAVEWNDSAKADESKGAQTKPEQKLHLAELRQAQNIPGQIFTYPIRTEDMSDRQRKEQPLEVCESNEAFMAAHPQHEPQPVPKDDNEGLLHSAWNPWTAKGRHETWKYNERTEEIGCVRSDISHLGYGEKSTNRFL